MQGNHGESDRETAKREWHVIKNQPSSLIDRNTDELNEILRRHGNAISIRGECVESKLTLHFRDRQGECKQLIEAEDRELPDGQVGLIAGAGENTTGPRPAEVKFANFAIK